MTKGRLHELHRIKQQASRGMESGWMAHNAVCFYTTFRYCFNSSDANIKRTIFQELDLNGSVAESESQRFFHSHEQREAQ